MLSTLIGEYHDTWEEHIRSVCMAYNTSIQPTTGYSPFFLMFGRQARLPIDIAYGTQQVTPTGKHQYVCDLRKSLHRAYEDVRKNFNLKLSRQKEFYNRKVHGNPFDKDNLVWLHSTVIPRGKSHKFHRPWTGPYRVVKRLSDVTYRIQSLGGRRKRLVVHFDRLKPCDPNTRFADSNNSVPDSSPSSTSLPTSTDTHPIFGEQLELIDQNRFDETGPVRRYPQRQRVRPDRLGVSVEH